MKKLFFLALTMCISFHIHAQKDSAGAPKELDSLLVNIDKKTVTSGIIYERTLQLANLYNYNRDKNSNTADFNFFRQSLLEMYRASNAKKFISIDDLDAKLEGSSSKNNVVDIGILNTQFNILNYNEDEPKEGGLILDTVAKKFIQIPDAIPFYMMHNTVISPLKDAVEGTEIVFKFSKSFFFTNGVKTINNMKVSFGDGNSKTIISNGEFIEGDVAIKYSTSGNKTLEFNIEYNDGTKMKTKGVVYFVNTELSTSAYSSCNTTDALRQDFNNIPADIDFTGYNVGDPKIKSKINYRVYYSNGNTQKLIKKPIIIVDGFDPGDKRKIEDCDCEQDAECASKYKDANGNFDASKHRSIVDMMQYYDNSYPTPLLPILRNKGYDVIIVNFPKYSTTNLNNGQQVAIDGGAYYIESNAMSLIKLIKDTNVKLEQNGSDKKIAIIAPSMAGQISRYALSYMEKEYQETNINSWKHNVYLWVSVDSPHLGANIPLGDQALLNLVKESSADANRFYSEELSSPAAQEQLIEFHREGSSYSTVNQNFLNGQTTSQGLSMDRGNSMFQRHYNDQNSNGVVGSHGWPLDLRKIAVINGSLTGSKEAQAINGSPISNFAGDAQTVLNIRGFQRIHIDLLFGSITFRIHIASLESMFLNSTGNNGRIARFKKLTNDKITQAVNINNRGVMDNVPGGFLDAQGQIAGPTLDTNPVPGNGISGLRSLSIDNIIYSISQALGGSEWQLREYNPIHSFIPTFSSIAHLNPNQSWANSLDYNLACPTNKQTPFDSYFGGEKNTPHTSFTKESVAWLLKELDGNPQLPNYPMDNIPLTGPEIICLNTNTPYSFNDICKLPSTVSNWYVSDNLEIISQTDYSITVKGIQNGDGTITALFPNGKTIIKKIHTGSPTLVNFTYGNNSSTQSLCIAAANNYSYSIPELNTTDKIIANLSGLTPAEASVNANWQWDKLNNLIILNGTKNSRNVCTLGAGLTSVRVKAHNACGWSDWFELPFEITELPLSYQRVSQSIYNVFPNPSNNMVNIDLADLNHSPDVSAAITGELFDMIGFSKGIINMVNNKATFSVSGLPPGIYVVKIYINGLPESHQIAVQ